MIAILTLCFGIFGLNVENLTISSYQGGFIGSTLGEICLHAFGLFIVYRRFGIGLEIVGYPRRIIESLYVIISSLLGLKLFECVGWLLKF